MSGRASETLAVYRTVVRNRSLRRVLAAFFAFSAQEYGVWIAIVVFAYEQGGPSTAGLVAIAQLIPSALVAPIGSVLGDRMRRDRALAGGYAIQAVANGACAVALWTSPPLVVYACAVIAACAITLTRPVHHALLPELSETPDELTAANSISSSVEGLGMLVGPIVAAVILAAGGAGAVLVAFAVTSALGAFAASRLRLVQVTIRDPGDAAPKPALVRDALDGLRELRRDPGGPSLALLGSSQFFILGALDVLLRPARDRHPGIRRAGGGRAGVAPSASEASSAPRRRRRSSDGDGWPRRSCWGSR